MLEEQDRSISSHITCSTLLTMTTHNEDDGVRPEINSNENVDGDGNGGVPTENIEAEIVDTSPDRQSCVEDTDPITSSNEDSSLPKYKDASQQTKCPVPHGDESSPGDPTEGGIGDITEDQGKADLEHPTSIADAPIPSDANEGSSPSTETSEKEPNDTGETDHNPFSELSDRGTPESKVDDQHSTESPSTEDSSHGENSTIGESTEGLSKSSSNSSECDHETPEDKESPVDPDTPPTDPVSDTSQPSDQEEACEDVGDSQDMPFPDTIVDLYRDRDIKWSKYFVRHEDPEKIDDESPSRKEWVRRKREEGQGNKYLDQIMSMVGHEDVKAHFLHVKDRLDVAKRWREDIRQLKLDLILHGNHGTGKSTWDNIDHILLADYV